MECNHIDFIQGEYRSLYHQMHNDTFECAKCHKKLKGVKAPSREEFIEEARTTCTHKWPKGYKKHGSSIVGDRCEICELTLKEQEELKTKLQKQKDCPHINSNGEQAWVNDYCSICSISHRKYTYLQAWKNISEDVEQYKKDLNENK
jgi:hypothetical protein